MERCELRGEGRQRKGEGVVGEPVTAESYLLCFTRHFSLMQSENLQKVFLSLVPTVSLHEDKV